MVLIACAVAAVTLAMCWKHSKVRQILMTVRYEMVYWLLGGAAMVDDILYGWKNKLKDLPKRTGEVAVITGGSRGIGYEVVKKLLECDMHVIIGCRKTEAGNEAINSIRKKGITTGRADVFQLDTSSMASVRKFAKSVLSNTNEIHVLINNAGIMFVPHTLTEDGFESQFCVNYLGHFLLCHLLLPTLKETGSKSLRKARIVNVSSCAHIPGSINFEDINYDNTFYIPSQAYSQSKLAQLMFTKALERQMRSEGGRVISFAVHPGVVNTELFDGTTLKTLAPWAPKLFFKSPDQGAVSIVFAAMSESLENEGGAYVSNCRQTWVSFTAKNIELQDRLMQLSMDMLKIDKFGAEELGNISNNNS